MKKIPQSLRTWFVIHFIVDIIFAIPLLIAPVWLLQLLGFTVVEPIMTRLVGAALVGIGGASLLTRNKGRESYHSLLTLKILWSLTVILILVIALFQNGPWSIAPILALFILFSAVWIYYKTKLKY